VTWMLLALIELGVAAPEAPPPRLELIVRGVAETWADGGIGTAYRTGALSGGVGLVVTAHELVAVDLEFAYKRLAGQGAWEGSRFEMVPISLLPEFTWTRRGMTWFAGIGPTLTVFSERHPGGHDTAADPRVQVLQGGRIAVETRVGVRFDTGLVQQPMPPAVGGPVRGLAVEVYAARRIQKPGDNPGFNLSAWRAALGLGLRF